MNTNQKKQVIAWLGMIIFLIFAMVIVGGITRLTHSGLSIVEWKPLMGAIPPISEEAWNETFDKYKQSPEYELNKSMTLSEFKFIFYWEYFHRLLGRLIGVIFLIPFLYFYIKKYFDRKLVLRLAIGFALGGLQGFMGWFMVKSGLVDNPHVSHYRLAAHLAIAFGIAAYLFWVALDIANAGKKPQVPHKRFGFSVLITAGIFLQIIFGAFTAGKKAGFGYNTFPKMDDMWIPDEVFLIEPWWLNFFETHAAIQFMHRLIAWILVFGVPVILIIIRKELTTKILTFSMNLLLIALGIQFLLGVLTILLIVSYEVSIPTIHQAGAFILFLISIYFNYSLRRNFKEA